METLKIHVYSDGGHGWARVKRPLLTTLGIANKITYFSYQRGDWVYLEEDCDATRLVEAMKAHGIEPVFIEHYSHGVSKIRSYDRYYKGELK
jgi:hypothetical protein